MVSSKKKWKQAQLLKVYPVQEQKPFVIIIPSYNNAVWVERNVRSVLEQKYDNFRVVYVDDASTDRTYEAVLEEIGKSSQGFRVRVVRNENNRGATENFYRTIHLCSPEEIVLMLDGDDWLASELVLQQLNEVYADPDVWMSCGNYLEYPSYSYTIGKYSGEIPREVIEKNALRKYLKTVFPLSHLKTFYASLFHQIRQEDLLFEGKFFDAAYDQAIMIPMAEMAGFHYRHIKDVLYIYNRMNPLNDDKVRGERQRRCSAEVKLRSAYQPLQNLPFRTAVSKIIENSEGKCSEELR